MDYYQKGQLERLYIQEVVNDLRKSYDVKYYTSPPESKDKWDAMIYIFEKGEATLKKRFLLECKVRDKHYPELLLEKIKYNNLKQIRNKWDKESLRDCGTKITSEVVYLSITPNGSYWFNLDKIKITNWITEYHNISTIHKSKGKVEKVVTYLPITEAKVMKYKTGDLTLDPRTEFQIGQRDLNNQRNICIFRGWEDLNKK